MPYILFVGLDYEQYIELKVNLPEVSCIYTVGLRDGIKLFNQQQFSLILLNLSLIASDAAQEELLLSFRCSHPAPIIALCNNMQDLDVVRLLKAGADQVLPVQTSNNVLIAYAQTLLNRYTTLNYMDREQSSQAVMRVGDFTVDVMRRHVFVKSKEIKLTRKEFDLLIFFAKNPERVLTEDQIIETVWGTEKDFHSDLSKPIHRLRQKIEPNCESTYIFSVRGVGYQFMPRPKQRL